MEEGRRLNPVGLVAGSAELRMGRGRLFFRARRSPLRDGIEDLHHTHSGPRPVFEDLAEIPVRLFIPDIHKVLPVDIPK